jgi:hypothetical protein
VVVNEKVIAPVSVVISVNVKLSVSVVKTGVPDALRKESYRLKHQSTRLSGSPVKVGGVTDGGVVVIVAFIRPMIGKT